MYSVLYIEGYKDILCNNAPILVLMKLWNRKDPAWGAPGFGVGLGVVVALGVGLGEEDGVGLGDDGSAEKASIYWNSAIPALSLNVELKEMGSLVVQVKELLSGVTIRGSE